MSVLPHSAHLMILVFYYHVQTLLGAKISLRSCAGCHSEKWPGKSTATLDETPGAGEEICLVLLCAPFILPLNEFCWGRGSESYALFSSLFSRMLHLHIYEKCFTDAHCAVLALICSFCIYIMTLSFRWGYSFAFWDENTVLCPPFLFSGI